MEKKIRIVLILFLSFREFINEIYLRDYEDIFKKITEREIFVIKKFVVYFIEMSLTFKNQKGKRKIAYSKFRNCLVNFHYGVISNFNKSFYEENKILIVREKKNRKE